MEIADADEADAYVHAIVQDWRTAPLSAADRALCAFATKLTLHNAKMMRTDLDALRALGFDDRAIHDAVQVIGYFNYINRVAHGLGVEPEGWIRPWGAT